MLMVMPSWPRMAYQAATASKAITATGISFFAFVFMATPLVVCVSVFCRLPFGMVELYRCAPMAAIGMRQTAIFAGWNDARRRRVESAGAAAAPRRRRAAWRVAQRGSAGSQEP